MGVKRNWGGETMTDVNETELPDSLALAWGLRTRPGRGPRPSLTLDRIVTAAIAVADADGLAAVSMSRVAGELGVATMSLYRYVPAKSDLLTLMIDVAPGPPPAPRAPDEQWRPALERWARALLEALRRHPWVRQVPVTGPPITPQSVAWMETGLASLRDTGLRGLEQLSTITLLSNHAREWASLTADMNAAAEAAGETGQEAENRYWQQLAMLTATGPFPALRELIGHLAEEEPEQADADFAFGLDRILDGVAVLIEQRRTG